MENSDKIPLPKKHSLNSFEKMNMRIDEQRLTELNVNLQILEKICRDLKKLKKPFYNGLHKFETLDQKKSIAELQHNLGMFYFEMKDYDRAVNEFNNGIAIATNENSKAVSTMSYLSEANALLNINKKGAFSVSVKKPSV